jgi:large subunit ribosomal protein L21
MYAIVISGGRQYKVAEGQKIFVDRIEAKEGDEVILDNVLFVRKEDQPLIGTPKVDGVTVKAVVKRQFKSPKIIVFKKRPKKGYKKKQGHREQLTELQITKIEMQVQ